MDKAWFFGDSFTYGSGCTPRGKYYKKYPEKREKLWTTIVAETKNLQEVNLGIPGSSIPVILNEILRTIPSIKSGDHVYMSDTAVTRFILPDPNTNKITSTVYGYLDGEQPVKEKSTTFNYVENCIVPYLEMWGVYYFEQYNSIRKILMDKGAHVFFWSHLVWSGEKKFHTIAQDTNGEVKDGHFSWQGHKEMAKMVLSINTNNPIKINII